jgi:hypothetical protein
MIDLSFINGTFFHDDLSLLLDGDLSEGEYVAGGVLFIIFA